MPLPLFHLLRLSNLPAHHYYQSGSTIQNGKANPYQFEKKLKKVNFKFIVSVRYSGKYYFPQQVMRVILDGRNSLKNVGLVEPFPYGSSLKIIFIVALI